MAVTGSRWQRTIGIVGGLGPHAHITFEQELLAQVESAGRDQDYPPWVLSSLPGTPDRTAALLDGGTPPTPWLVESLKNLEGRADFAAVICNTAHAFLDEARAQVTIPVLHMIRETVLGIVARVEPGSRVGLLATDGTLASTIYPQTSRAMDADLHWRSLLELPQGRELQGHLVMGSIFGEGHHGGLKAGLTHDPQTGEAYADRLRQAVERLVDDGCAVVVLGCTELSAPMKYGVQDLPLVDPIRLTAERCLQIAAGEAPLPEGPGDLALSRDHGPAPGET